mgnify:CR=1 FL=1
MSNFIEMEVNEYLLGRLQEWADCSRQWLASITTELGESGVIPSELEHQVHKALRMEVYAHELTKKRQKANLVLRAHYSADHTPASLNLEPSKYYELLNYAHSFMLAKICTEVTHSRRVW